MNAAIVAMWLASVGGAVAGHELEVTKTRAAIMEKPQYWGRPVAQVSLGQKVRVLDESKYPWLKVEFSKRTGWIHSSNFASGGKVSFAGAADKEASKKVNEKALTQAARGFSPEVEKEYRATNKELDAVYDALNVHEQLESATPDDEQMLAFLKEGGLHVPAEQGAGGGQ
ncbi:MAG: SH3 domain-containing protein [Myxococcales bacterium]